MDTSSKKFEEAAAAPAEDRALQPTKTPKPLLTRFRKLRDELVSLDEDLQKAGDRDLADAVKRARREVELIERQGIAQARGV